MLRHVPLVRTDVSEERWFLRPRRRHSSPHLSGSTVIRKEFARKYRKRWYIYIFLFIYLLEFFRLFPVVYCTVSFNGVLLNFSREVKECEQCVISHIR
jgi:hypothetical protein